MLLLVVQYPETRTVLHELEYVSTKLFFFSFVVIAFSLLLYSLVCELVMRRIFFDVIGLKSYRIQYFVCELVKGVIDYLIC
jgi:hypothetical protein